MCGVEWVACCEIINKIITFTIELQLKLISTCQKPLISI